MRSRVLSGAIVAVLFSALTLGLSACTPTDTDENTPPPPVAFTMVNGQPVARVCLPLTIQDMDLTSYASLDDEDGTLDWEASGNAKVKAGTEFVVGTALPNTHVVTDKKSDFLVRDFTFELDVLDSRGGSHWTWSEIDHGYLKEGKWLDGDGDPTTKPCVPGSCPSTKTKCTQKWTGLASAQLPEPTISPAARPLASPSPTQSTIAPIAFTRVNGVATARLCANLEVDVQVFSQSLVDGDPSSGYYTVVEASSLKKDTFKAGTEWPVGKPLPGEKVGVGAQERPDLSKGYYRIELRNFGTSVYPTVDGTFNAKDLRDGQWLNAKGEPEASACAD